MRSVVRLSWQHHDPLRGFRTGVSLHSHTLHSREKLEFIPRLALRVPLLSWEFRRLQRRFEASTGKLPDFSAAYWTPPLTPLEAFDVERTQIEETLGLAAVVSLTDHDNIEAADCCEAAGRYIPISVEWTVPFADTFFHLGVHNLPTSTAPEWMAALTGYTRSPRTTPLQDLLSRLHEQEGVLIVLNHPMWDQAEIGRVGHTAALTALLQQAGCRIHALEFNGLRSWNENQRVLDLALECSRPVISGGDRHGREPNAVINLSHASNLMEFSSEIRSGQSHVLVLPQYREPLRFRILQTLMDVMGDCPGPADRRQWMDRVFYARNGGHCVPLSCLWKDGGPRIVRCFSGGLQLARSPAVQRMIRPWLRGPQDAAVPNSPWCK